MRVLLAAMQWVAFFMSKATVTSGAEVERKVGEVVLAKMRVREILVGGLLIQCFDISSMDFFKKSFPML